MFETVTRVLAELPMIGDDIFVRSNETEATEILQRDLHQDAEVLHAIEVRSVPELASPPRQSLRIAAWNLERCKYVEPSAELLRQSGADIILLSEMDVGMARSGNRHTTRDIADSFHAGYAYAVEFVELGLGTPEEELRFKGQSNAKGLHGNAIVSSVPFCDPTKIALDHGSLWFDLDWHHRRIGGRNALAVSLKGFCQKIILISIHLETLTNPEGRARQVETILDYVEREAAGAPVVLAGDFNVAALPLLDRPLESETQTWFEEPEKFEPLFKLLRAAGFDWQKSNTREQTRRTMNDGRPEPAVKRIDWFFTRGLTVSNPKVWPAQDEKGKPLSDHEMITLDIELPASRA
jgi:endonuclease/exonuclease/phosphatase family metal-dependent hydrolase